MNPILELMIAKFFAPDEKYRRQPRRAWGYNRSKHMLPSGVKATKAYADGRQMASWNRRNMRKRK